MLQVLCDVIELLSGTGVPNKVRTFSGQPARAAEQLLQHYAAVLAFLDTHGALMNGVRAEHLLDEESLDAVLKLREARAESDQSALHVCALWCAVRAPGAALCSCCSAARREIDLP